MENTNTTTGTETSTAITGGWDATPAKLKDGTWGVKLRTGRAVVGDIAEVETRGGDKFFSRITKIVWQGKGQAGGTLAAAERI